VLWFLFLCGIIIVVVVVVMSVFVLVDRVVVAVANTLLL